MVRASPPPPKSSTDQRRAYTKKIVQHSSKERKSAQTNLYKCNISHVITVFSVQDCLDLREVHL